MSIETIFRVTAIESINRGELSSLGSREWMMQVNVQLLHIIHLLEPAYDLTTFGGLDVAVHAVAMQ
jgi:hypothetical protein